jgi:hypothetical protein
LRKRTRATAKDIRSRQRPPRVGQHDARGGQCGGRFQLFADAADPDRPRRETGGNIGAQLQRQGGEALIAERLAPEPGQGAQCRRRIAGAAADPGRRRQSLVEMQRGAGSDRGALSEEPGGAQYQIVIEPADCRRFRPGDRQGQRIGRHGGDFVADIGEGDQAVEQVIAVGAPPDDVQIKVDLGRRERRDQDAAGHPRLSRREARRAAVSSGRFRASPRSA